MSVSNHSHLKCFLFLLSYSHIHLYTIYTISIVSIGCLYFWVVFMLTKFLPLSSCRVPINYYFFKFQIPALITRDNMSSSVETLYPYNLL